MSLCWKCKRAVLGCSWSKSFEPVEGWKAVKTIVCERGKENIESYLVLECPLFLWDGKEDDDEEEEQIFHSA